jgi:hypothetical protein
VQVTLSEEEAGYFAQCERLHIFAFAESRERAMEDLHAQVLHFFSSYSALDDGQVTGLARELRDLYRQHFRRL